jgi:hypothetical protein
MTTDATATLLRLAARTGSIAAALPAMRHRPPPVAIARASALFDALCAARAAALEITCGVTHAGASQAQAGASTDSLRHDRRV